MRGQLGAGQVVAQTLHYGEGLPGGGAGQYYHLPIRDKSVWNQTEYG